jgi:hypothetical protein
MHQLTKALSEALKTLSWVPIQRATDGPEESLASIVPKIKWATRVHGRHWDLQFFMLFYGRHWDIHFFRLFSEQILISLPSDFVPLHP